MQVEQEWYLFLRTQEILHSVRRHSIQSQRSLTAQEVLKLVQQEVIHGTR